jgi:hypothetical protein
VSRGQYGYIQVERRGNRFLHQQLRACLGSLHAALKTLGSRLCPRSPAAPFVAAGCLGMRIVDFLCVEKPSRKSVLRVTVKSTEFPLAALCAKRGDLTNDL